MKALSIAVFALVFSANSMAQSVKFSNTGGVAIKGYDPVAYFLEHKALKGKDDFSFDWSSSKWNFISQANLDSFKIAPLQYAPQYGGYCAMGCSEDHLAPTDPNAWTIVDNKLYLNYNMDVKKAWFADTAKRIKAADDNWPALNK